MYISYDNSPTFKVTIWDSPCEAPSLVRSSEDPVATIHPDCLYESCWIPSYHHFYW